MFHLSINMFSIMYFTFYYYIHSLLTYQLWNYSEEIITIATSAIIIYKMRDKHIICLWGGIKLDSESEVCIILAWIKILTLNCCLIVYYPILPLLSCTILGEVSKTFLSRVQKGAEVYLAKAGRKRCIIPTGYRKIGRTWVFIN